MTTATTVDSTTTTGRASAEDVALRVEDLHVYYETAAGDVKAVNGVSFDLKAGERLALVGESGSGKSTMATALMRMTRPPGKIVAGSIHLGERDLLQLSEPEMRRARLAEIALVPQGAMNSLNPVIRIEKQIIDGILDHVVEESAGRSSGSEWSAFARSSSEGALLKKPTRSELREKVADLLINVGLSPSVARMYPHELSGGMKQRAVLAIATCLSPKVILADEPTSALDVVVQRQIMQTLGRLQSGIDAAVILVGHDMGLVAQFADTIGVMYAGRLVELGPVNRIFEDPQHPYTKLLIDSLPSFSQKREFVGIPGMPPRLLNLPTGCAFYPRCPSAMDICRDTDPLDIEVKPNWRTACHLHTEAVSNG
jgi:peptide/nickel transport system ATP-binding protein